MAEGGSRGRGRSKLDYSQWNHPTNWGHKRQLYDYAGILSNIEILLKHSVNEHIVKNKRKEAVMTAHNSRPSCSLAIYYASVLLAPLISMSRG